MIKTITNNDVADTTTANYLLELRKKDRQMLEEAYTIESKQIVSLGKYGAQWAGESETKANTKDTMWDFTACGLPYLWTHYGVRGENINVFVLDTGIDLNHTVFAPNKTKIMAKSFVPSVSASEDGAGHGTWVCGKIGGSGVGIAPNCTITSLRVLDDSGTGRSDFTTKALEWILKQDNFPHVINMSLGGPKRNAVQEKLLWQLYRKGAVIVVASGNQGDDDRFYPAGYDGVVAVGAVDKNKTKAVFSNYGANIDVCAPGVACYSSYPFGGFRLLQGTSMAAPTVAGLLTLGLSYGLRKGHKSGEALRNLVLSCLEMSCEDLGDKGKDPYYGFGCIDGRRFFNVLEQRL